ncbi:hypothetical protein Q7P37_000224 [Cladosporium fusiforme]
MLWKQATNASRRDNPAAATHHLQRRRGNLKEPGQGRPEWGAGYCRPSLHGRSRAVQQASKRTSSENAPESNEVSETGQDDAASTGRSDQVVRYVPPTPRETRSQQDRLAKADAGDLRARLDLITLEAAEAGLRRRLCKHQPDRSMLSYLQDPGDGLARHQAASAILEQLADETEETASDSVLVFRYIETHGIWKDHPGSDVRSAEDFVKQLNNSEFVQANIVFGTSAQSTKRSCSRMIATSWGNDWFEKIPSAIKKATWSRPEECSKRTLTQIAANAKRGISLEKAVESWTEAINKRNDPATRREHQPRSRAIVPPSTAKPPPSRPNYTTGSQPRKARKRKRLQGEEEDGTRGEDEEQGEGSWVKGGERSMVKCVRKHKIRKDVDGAEDAGGGSDCPNTPAEELDGHLTPPSAQPSKVQAANTTSNPQFRQRPTCDRPAVALMFRKFVEFFGEIPSLDNDEGSERRCCDACRPIVTEKSTYLRGELMKWTAELEEVQSHMSRGDRVLPSQEIGISPFKRAHRRQSPLTPHGSGFERSAL